MNDKLEIYNLYHNNLDTKKFSQMLDSNSQSYKFYWLEAILTLSSETSDDLLFDDIINEMIVEAWHTVTEYHLKLGPTINGKSENFLEHAIKVLHNTGMASPNPQREEIISVIKHNDKIIKDDKYRLTDYVPYKLLYPFLDDEGLGYLRKDQRTRLIAYMIAFKDTLNPFYTIIDGRGLQKKIRIGEDWRRLLLDNYSVIKSWIQYRKVIFLQDRNPGVPGIVYKLAPESDYSRKLKYARELWVACSIFSGKPIIDIYTGEVLASDKFDLDHFVPRSFIANDELWNLTPMDGNLNSSKNNRLPIWEEHFPKFAQYQYYLYDIVFSSVSENDKLRIIFDKCRRDNINTIWATENLYIPGHDKDTFINLLSNYMKPIYDSANIQGYALWTNIHQKQL